MYCIKCKLVYRSFFFFLFVLDLHCERITRMMNLQMLVVIGFRGGALATNRAMEGTFACMNAPMLDQIVMSME